jgi:hypothetical protein
LTFDAVILFNLYNVLSEMIDSFILRIDYEAMMTTMTMMTTMKTMTTTMMMLIPPLSPRNSCFFWKKELREVGVHVADDATVLRPFATDAVVMGGGGGL